jgi:Uma2 family endonuclease
MGAVKTLLTFEEFEQLPDPETGESLELLDGEIIELPPPQKRHMLGSEELFKRLKQQVEALRVRLPEVPLGKVHMEMGYLLRGRRSSWFRPDVSVTWPDQPGDRYYEQSPMIVIEIVSEHDRANDIERKEKAFITALLPGIEIPFDAFL